MCTIFRAAQSCEMDNGGCEEREVCELKPVQCVRAPCPSVVVCSTPTTPTPEVTATPTVDVSTTVLGKLVMIDL